MLDVAKGKQRSTLKLDTKAFESLILKLDAMGGDVRKAVTDALEQASETIANDTEAALAPGNLPAGGKYSTGRTAETIIRDSAVRWDGLSAWVPVGFDFSLPGAGGYLITGTPKMQPDHELNRMYKQKKYMAGIQNEIREVLMDHLQEGFEKK